MAYESKKKEIYSNRQKKKRIKQLKNLIVKSEALNSRYNELVKESNYLFDKNNLLNSKIKAIKGLIIYRFNAKQQLDRQIKNNINNEEKQNNQIKEKTQLIKDLKEKSLNKNLQQEESQSIVIQYSQQKIDIPLTQVKSNVNQPPQNQVSITKAMEWGDPETKANNQSTQNNDQQELNVDVNTNNRCKYLIAINSQLKEKNNNINEANNNLTQENNKLEEVYQNLKLQLNTINEDINLLKEKFLNTRRIVDKKNIYLLEMDQGIGNLQQQVQNDSAIQNQQQKIGQPLPYDYSTVLLQYPPPSNISGVNNSFSFFYNLVEQQSKNNQKNQIPLAITSLTTESDESNNISQQFSKMDLDEIPEFVPTTVNKGK